MKTKHIIAWALVLAAGCGDGGAPYSILVVADPARLYYHTGQEVILRGIVYNFAGEEIPDVEVTWTVEPEGGASEPVADVEPNAAHFTLGSPGAPRFRGCVGLLCDTIMLRVDDGMPSLEVSSPVPGAELDDPAGIVVTGSVADGSDVRVYANGVPADVDSMGRFSVTVPAQFGVNHVAVDATDGLTDASQVEMDVLWAESYTPAVSEAGTPELTFDDGMAISLGQNFFGDDVPLDLTASPVTTRDLADLLELVISRIDARSFVPDPVFSSTTFTLRATNLQLLQPQAQILLTDGGADVFVRIGAATVNTSGFLDFSGATLPLMGTVTASVIAYSHLTVTKASETDEILVEMTPPVVGIESLNGSFSSAETLAVFQLATGVLRQTLESAFSDAIGSTVEESVPTLLRDALTSIDGALAGLSIPLDVAPFPPINIAIDGRMQSIQTTYRREMLATMRTTMGTDTPAVHPESRGVARFAATEMTPDFFRGGSLSLGLRLAVLNGLLHSLWNSGLLSVDATPLLPEGVRGLVSEAHLDGLLAPVLRPPRSGESDDLLLTLGQLELELNFMGETVRYAVSLNSGVTVSVADNRIALGLAETPEITVWTLVPPSNERLLTPDTVRTLLSELWPDIRESITSGLAFELPLPALGDLGGLAPMLSTFTLDLESSAPVYLRGEVLFLDANLIGTLP